MVTIAIADEQTALQIGEIVEGERSYIVKADDGKRFRRLVHCNQPKVLVVDARLGGSAFEAIQELPRLIESVKSKPLIIVLLPSDAPWARAAAIDMGAYEVISLSDPSWLENLASAISDARVSRLAGLLPSLPRQVPLVFH